MKRIHHALIVLVVISATSLWAIAPTYGQSRPRVVAKAKTPPAATIDIETRPRRVFPPKTKQIQVQTLEQYVDKIYRLIDEYMRPVNR